MSNHSPSNDLPSVRDWMGKVGVWMQVKPLDRLGHYFVKKNKSVNGAISLCGIYVADIESLAAFSCQRKCLVCALWDDARKEAGGTILSRGTS